MRERLMDLIKYAVQERAKFKKGGFLKNLVDYLMDNGVLVISSEIVWHIEKNKAITFVIPVRVDDLPLFVIKDLEKYEYYTSKEAAAEAALKGGAE